MHSRDELFLRSLECYCCVYLNTKMTLSWALKQFVTRVHTIFSIYTRSNPRCTWWDISRTTAVIFESEDKRSTFIPVRGSQLLTFNDNIDITTTFSLESKLPERYVCCLQHCIFLYLYFTPITCIIPPSQNSLLFLCMISVKKETQECHVWVCVYVCRHKSWYPSNKWYST